jgi:alpha-amylase
LVFKKQVEEHDQLIYKLFGLKPRVFRNTEMIYSDEIGNQLAAMGFKAVLTEGAKHVLGWKSPNYVYVNAINPRLKVLMRNFKLSDDIAFRFSNTNWNEFPLTANKFVGWLSKENETEEVVNLFLNYDSFGERQPKESGIFEFLYNLPVTISKLPQFQMATPSDVIEQLQPVSLVSVPYPISWADEERDLTAWLGNEMQKEAFEKLYNLGRQMTECTDEELIKDWNYLQESDHFYYMSTKYFSDGGMHSYYNPFDSPYEAFINYMNVLSDFKIRLNANVPENEIDNEIASLQKIIEEKEKKIKLLEARMLSIQKQGRKKK